MKTCLGLRSYAQLYSIWFYFSTPHKDKGKESLHLDILWEYESPVS